MTDKPRKILTLKRKPSDTPSAEEAGTSTSEKSSKLLGKRIIRRAERPETQSVKPVKPHNKPPTRTAKAKPKPQVPVIPETPPSELQAKALDELLSQSVPVWTDYKPLALGIQDELYDFMQQHLAPASKRVVQRLLRMHCRHGKYLQNVLDYSERFNLAGDSVGDISQAERDHAARTLESYEARANGVVEEG